MRIFTRTALATALALGLAAPAMAQFSNVYFFGDSLTDMGSYKPVLPPGTGMFTTNPGPVWAQPFAQSFGFSASPANQGGNDYAYGGARVTLSPGYPATAPTGAAVPVATQIQQLLAKGPLDSNAIYSVWAGANDLFVQLSDVQSGAITAAQAQANLATAATQLAQQVGVLRAAGAQYILVGNIPLPLSIFNSVSLYMIDPVSHEYVFNTGGNSVLGIIYYGVRAGVFRKAEPFAVYLSLIAPVVMFRVTAPAREALTRERLAPVAALDRDAFVAHVKHGVLASLNAGARSPLPVAAPAASTRARRTTRTGARS